MRCPHLCSRGSSRGLGLLHALAKVYKDLIIQARCNVGGGFATPTDSPTVSADIYAQGYVTAAGQQKASVVLRQGWCRCLPGHGLTGLRRPGSACPDSPGEPVLPHWKRDHHWRPRRPAAHGGRSHRQQPTAQRQHCRQHRDLGAVCRGLVHPHDCSVVALLAVRSLVCSPPLFALCPHPTTHTHTHHTQHLSLSLSLCLSPWRRFKAC